MWLWVGNNCSGKLFKKCINFWNISCGCLWCSGRKSGWTFFLGRPLCISVSVLYILIIQKIVILFSKWFSMVTFRIFLYIYVQLYTNIYCSEQSFIYYIPILSWTEFNQNGKGIQTKKKRKKFNPTVTQLLNKNKHQIFLYIVYLAYK